MMESTSVTSTGKRSNTVNVPINQTPHGIDPGNSNDSIDDEHNGVSNTAASKRRRKNVTPRKRTLSTINTVNTANASPAPATSSSGYQPRDIFGVGALPSLSSTEPTTPLILTDLPPSPDHIQQTTAINADGSRVQVRVGLHHDGFQSLLDSDYPAKLAEWINSLNSTPSNAPLPPHDTIQQPHTLDHNERGTVDDLLRSDSGIADRLLSHISNDTLDKLLNNMTDIDLAFQTEVMEPLPSSLAPSVSNTTHTNYDGGSRIIVAPPLLPPVASLVTPSAPQTISSSKASTGSTSNSSVAVRKTTNVVPNAAILAHYQTLLKSTSEDQLRAFAHTRHTAPLAPSASSSSLSSSSASST